MGTEKITVLCADGTGDPETVRFASPYDLFRKADGLPALLTACGEPPEMLPDGGASDYDKLAALCRALPQAPGHPLRRRILSLIAEGFAWYNPAPDPAALWRHLVHYTSPDSPEGDLTLAALARRMGAESVAPDGRIILPLPDCYTFVRPDPYHAVLYRGREAAGETLTPAERDLLFTQRVRETAEVCLARALTLEPVGACGQLEQLARYLTDTHRLPALVCAVTDPEKCDTPPAFPAGVRTALCLRGNAAPAELERKLTSCAARTPLLALDGVLLTVRCAADLGQIPVWRRILRRFLDRSDRLDKLYLHEEEEFPL